MADQRPDPRNLSRDARRRLKRTLTDCAGAGGDTRSTQPESIGGGGTAAAVIPTADRSLSLKPADFVTTAHADGRFRVAIPALESAVLRGTGGWQPPALTSRDVRPVADCDVQLCISSSLASPVGIPDVLPSSSAAFVPPALQHIDCAGADNLEMPCGGTVGQVNRPNVTIDPGSAFTVHHVCLEKEVDQEAFTMKFPDYSEDLPPAPEEFACEVDDSLPCTNKDLPIYAGAPLNREESLTAILSFSQSEHISGVGLDRLLSLINLHLPHPNICFSSSSDLFKALENRNEEANIHYFCSVCYKGRQSETDLCDTCTSEDRFVHYYLSLPIIPQIQKIYCQPNFLSDIAFKSTRTKLHPDNIEHIYDGSVYKEASHNILSNDCNISLMWNTDGIQIYNSTTYSLWPFYLVINELPPLKRYRSENIIIAGIWGSLDKPHPNVYLQPIYNDLVILRSGIEVNCCDEKRIVRCILLCGTSDAPARSSFLNMKSHSGYSSCPRCLIIGEKSVRSDMVLVFPFEENVQLRSMELYEQHVQEAVETASFVCGVRGPTLLANLVPCIYSSTAIDTMHCVYLGVTRQLLNLWFTKTNAAYCIFDLMCDINKRIRAVAIPHFLQRRPETIDKLVHWKASQLKYFLFHLALPVLNGKLPQQYFDHLRLLVEGVAILNGTSISIAEIQRSRVLLNLFVQQFQELYGLRHMSSNVHLLRHLPDCVLHLGPLWETSCFPFEDLNGRLTNLIHGSRHAGLQIYSNLSIISELPLHVAKLQEGPVKKFCTQLTHKCLRLKITDKISNSLSCVGLFTNMDLDGNPGIKLALSSCNIAGTIKQFHRLLKDGQLYVAASYSRGLRVSSFINYVCNGTLCFGNLETFVKVITCVCKNQCSCIADYYAIVTELESDVAFQGVSHVKYCESAEGCMYVLELSSIQSVLCQVKFDVGFYLSAPINTIERE